MKKTKEVKETKEIKLLSSDEILSLSEEISEKDKELKEKKALLEKSLENLVKKKEGFDEKLGILYKDKEITVFDVPGKVTKDFDPKKFQNFIFADPTAQSLLVGLVPSSSKKFIKGLNAIIGEQATEELLITKIGKSKINFRPTEIIDNVADIEEVI